MAVGLIMIAGGVAAGIFGSLLGLGGGLLIVPLLTFGFELPIREAVAVSLVCVIVTSSASAGVYLQRQVANLRLGMTLELFTALGALAGGLIAFSLSDRVLAALFAVLLVYVAITMLRRREPAKPRADAVVAVAPPTPPGVPPAEASEELAAAVPPMVSDEAVAAAVARERRPAPHRQPTPIADRPAVPARLPGPQPRRRHRRIGRRGRDLGAARRRRRDHQGAADEPADGRPAARRDGDEQPHDRRDRVRLARSSTCCAAASTRWSPARPPSASSSAPRSGRGSRTASTCGSCGCCSSSVLLYTALQMLLRALGGA